MSAIPSASSPLPARGEGVVSKRKKFVTLWPNVCVEVGRGWVAYARDVYSEYLATGYHETEAAAKREFRARAEEMFESLVRLHWGTYQRPIDGRIDLVGPVPARRAA